MKYLWKRIFIIFLGIWVGTHLIPSYPDSLEPPLESEIITQISLKDSLQIELIRAVEEYIQNKFPKSQLSAETLVSACEQYRFDVCFALAQAEIESHLGTVGVASKTNSVWNVGAYDGRSSYKMEQLGLGYNHPDDSIEPYIQTIQKRYLGDSKTIQELLDNYVDLNGYRYASNPDYEKLLTQKYKQIHQSPIGIIQEAWWDCLT